MFVIVLMDNAAQGATKMFSVDAQERQISKALISCCALRVASDQGLRYLSLGNFLHMASVTRKGTFGHNKYCRPRPAPTRCWKNLYINKLFTQQEIYVSLMWRVSKSADPDQTRRQRRGGWSGSTLFTYVRRSFFAWRWPYDVTNVTGFTESWVCKRLRIQGL